jgi:hypothetical protein
MEEWLVLHLFSHALDPMSKYMFDIAGGGIFMENEITVATNFLMICKTMVHNGTQNNSPQERLTPSPKGTMKILL